jgi:hypothetical protein
MLPVCAVFEVSTMQMSRRGMVVDGATRNCAMECNDMQRKLVASTMSSVIVYLLQSLV